MRNTFLRVSKLKSDETSHHQPPPPPPLLPLPPPCRLLFHASTWIAPFTLDTGLLVTWTGQSYHVYGGDKREGVDGGTNPIIIVIITAAELLYPRCCQHCVFQASWLLQNMPQLQLLTACHFSVNLADNLLQADAVLVLLLLACQKKSFFLECIREAVLELWCTPRA